MRPPVPGAGFVNPVQVVRRDLITSTTPPPPFLPRPPPFPPGFQPPVGACSSGGATGANNARDCTALLALYTAWGNKPAAWTPGPASSYCTWAGVTCSAEGSVTRLCVPPC